MYDMTKNIKRNSLTYPNRHDRVFNKSQLRCWNCNKLLGTGRITEGYIEIRCSKCGQHATAGVHNATLATLAIIVLIK